MSLSKFIAQAGFCSRRQATELIKEGRVKVNNKVVTEPGYKVAPTDSVKVGRRIIKAEARVYIILNKPKGYVTTAADEKGRLTVLNLIGKRVKQRVYPVGRLDLQTTGLLLLTNDGDLTQKLAHPKHEIKKGYIATLDKSLEKSVMAKIKKGVRLRDGRVKIDAISCLSSKCNRVKVILHSGKYRILRRLFEHFGYEVTALDRSQYAGLKKSGLAQGSWRYLTAAEIKRLKTL